MIWATWRMERSVYVAATAVLAAVGVWLAVTGLRQEAAFASFNALHCAQPGSSALCMAAATRYYGASTFSGAGVAIGALVPGLLGLVIGVPIVAGEIGWRTNRLAWTQSISRTRWLLVKLAFGAATTVALMAALAPVLQWWSGAVQRGDRIVPPNFDVSGIVPIAYALFAFVLGALLGALVRRRGWAFALGLPIFAAARYLERSYLRRRLLPSVTTATAQVAPSNNWVIWEGFVPSRSKGRFVFQIQPASHYWALQGIEAAVFVAAACALAWLAVVVVRRWQV
ncbi:MAG: hypothetical protein ACRD0B_07020 [Acidimicrobiales bacterium]